MIADFSKAFEWGQGIAIYAPQWILGLLNAPELLPPLERDRWSARIVPRIATTVYANGYAKPTSPRAGWVQLAFELYAAVCMLNYPTYTDDEIVRCAMGIQFEKPANLTELEDNKLHAYQLQQAIDKNTAFGNVPPGV